MLMNASEGEDASDVSLGDLVGGLVYVGLYVGLPVYGLVKSIDEAQNPDIDLNYHPR